MHGIVVLIWECLIGYPFASSASAWGVVNRPGRDLTCTGTYCSKPVHLNLRLVHHSNRNGNNGKAALEVTPPRICFCLLRFVPVCFFFLPVCFLLCPLASICFCLSSFALFCFIWLGILCSARHLCLPASKCVWKAPKYRVTIAIVAIVAIVAINLSERTSQQVSSFAHIRLATRLFRPA